MDQHWLDNLARSLADGSSRRTVLRRLGKGLAAAAFMAVTPQVALSARTCSKSLTDCNGTCVDISTDSAHCGKCTVACAVGEVCVKGKCQPPVTCGSGTCLSGQACCGGNCAELASDESNCGKCGQACAAGEACVGGKCQAAVPCGNGTCSAGQSCCNGGCVDTNTDSANCGKCGYVCDPLGNYNGEVTCSAGVCQFTPGS